MTGIEAPDVLLQRLKLGREEFCQRLLTMLIVGGPYPRWNDRSTPTDDGAEFLRRLDELSFGPSAWPSRPQFVDELTLERRADGEKNAYPDYGVLWPDRCWLIELKSERGSHRDGQLPYYLAMGRHHHPDCQVDLTYLTPPLDKPAPPLEPWARYAHVTWDRAVAIARDVWGPLDEPDVRAALDALDDTVAHLLDETPTQWRIRWIGDADIEGAPHPAPAVPSVDEVDELAPDRRRDAIDALQQAMFLAGATSADGAQRALDAYFTDLAALDDMRLRVHELICDMPDESARRVRPWVWQWQSTGEPMTAAGRELGYELRFSRYAEPVC